MTKENLQSIAKKLSYQRNYIFDTFNKTFLKTKYRHAETHMYSTQARPPVLNRYSFEYDYTKPIKSEQLNILTLKAEKKYFTLGISCNGNELPFEQQYINIIFKTIFYNEEKKEYYQFNFVSKNFPILDFKEKFLKFSKNNYNDFNDLIKNFISYFHLELFKGNQTSNENLLYLNKHHYMF